jgi:hypothetical protein
MNGPMTAQSTPTETAASAFRALGQRDWQALAGFADSQALASLRQESIGMLILTTEQRLAGEKAEGGYNPDDVVIADHLARVGSQRIRTMPGNPTIEDLTTLSPSDFFVEWARASYGDETHKDPQRDVADLYRQIIGAVMETPEAAFILYRREVRYWDDDEFKVVLPGRVMILPVVRRDGSWHLQFNDDIGWSIDFSGVVFFERDFPIPEIAMPARVVPPEPSPPSLERTRDLPKPQDVVDSAFAAFATQDWTSFTRLVDPAVLRAFQQRQISYFAASIRSRDAYDEAKRKGAGFVLSFEDSLSPTSLTAFEGLDVPLITGPRTIGELARLSPDRFFEEWCRAAYGAGAGGFGSGKSNVERHTIGQVVESETRAHVLYRTPFRSNPDRVSLQWTEGGWRIALNNDIGWPGDLALEGDER